jgi:hypothetical protein
MLCVYERNACHVAVCNRLACVCGCVDMMVLSRYWRAASHENDYFVAWLVQIRARLWWGMHCHSCLRKAGRQKGRKLSMKAPLLPKLRLTRRRKRACLFLLMLRNRAVPELSGLLWLLFSLLMVLSLFGIFHVDLMAVAIYAPVFVGKLISSRLMPHDSIISIFLALLHIRMGFLE